MIKVSRSLTKNLTEDQQNDLMKQIGNSQLLLAVLQRFMLDRLSSIHREQLNMTIKDRDATLPLVQSLGEQKVLYRLVELFNSFGVDDHPLIKEATHVKMLGSVSQGE